MKLPDHVTIDGLHWEVKLTDMDHCGLTEPDDCRILIAKHLDDQQKIKTFWHELIHAFYASREVEDGRKLTEEEVARLVGPALFAFFQANSLEF